MTPSEAKASAALGASGIQAAADAVALSITRDYSVATTQELADMVALVQEVKYNLGTVETALTTILGKREGRIQGNLSDGRAFTLQRAQDRKEWDHEEWKRDTRRAIVQSIHESGIPEGAFIADYSEGEVWDLHQVLYDALARCQEVHGSTAPRSRALKALGLYASDYCASSPAGWRFNAIRPEDPATTTEKD